MSDFSQTEENYLKAIFKICERKGKAASTNAISNAMNTSAASVTDMIKRLEKKEFIHYERYKGVTLTETGNDIATSLIRKHRLWEVFLVEKLDFSWDEVHEIAEQLEHIRSPKLVERLEHFLSYPKFDPHGDPIPDEQGRFTYRKQILLTKLKKGDKGVIVGVYEHSPAFLQFLDQLGLVLGASVEILEKYDFDESLRVIINGQKEWTISKKVSQNLFLQQQ
ncbi:MAG: metal-dependent transcriptional regulator [Saprospiraceae bacterium]|jgi:DtxR family Mn-dependent transcriptional regulator|nr:metal-dependent transcriptional regulator [Saprospiraceae bacterium]